MLVKQNNLLVWVYGVDIDAQAVEVTKLSLFIKLLENEGKALSSSGQVQLFRNSDIHEKILPSLTSNIKCGNSLVGSDYYLNKDLTLFGIKEQRKINAFDWEKEFVKIFDQGGFDCVIGNPPYVLCQPGSVDESLLEYYKKYNVASYKIDLFHLFFERAINLLNTNGLMGFITPNTYLTNKYIKTLRQFILKNCDINNIVIHDKVFTKASVDVATIILKKRKKEKHIIAIEKTEKAKFFHIGEKFQTDWELDEECIFNVNMNCNIDPKNTVMLGDICNTYFGIQAYDRSSSISTSRISMTFLPIIDGEDIHPFIYAEPKKFFDYKPENIKSGGDWNVYQQERIVVRQIGNTPVVGLCRGRILASNTLYSIWTKNKDYSLRYLLCILTSKFLSHYWIAKYSDNKGLFPKIKGYQLKCLPIPAATPAQQEKLAKLADQMIEAKQKQSVVKSDKDKEELQKKISYIDQQINAAVYKLYGLTDDEIRRVEEK